jgi:hypothetical protein
VAKLNFEGRNAARWRAPDTAVSRWWDKKLRAIINLTVHLSKPSDLVP